jgi:hypothetical protein
VTTSQEWAERLGMVEPDEVSIPTIANHHPWDKVRSLMALGLGHEDIAVKLGIPARHIREFVLRGGKS